MSLSPKYAARCVRLCKSCARRVGRDRGMAAACHSGVSCSRAWLKSAAGPQDWCETQLDYTLRKNKGRQPETAQMASGRERCACCRACTRVLAALHPPTHPLTHSPIHLPTHPPTRARTSIRTRTCARARTHALARAPPLPLLSRSHPSQCVSAFVCPVVTRTNSPLPSYIPRTP